jgi:hypothetical protein
MANIVSAEALEGPQANPADEDDTLTRQAKSSGGGSQSRLRIVHSAAQAEQPRGGPQRVDMRPSDRLYPGLDRPPAMLDRTVQAQIGRLLRDVFADVAGEPVPERFVTLLAQLESKEKPR